MASLKFSRRLTFNQNLISGAVLFFTVGVYLAVLGLGAGGGKPSSQRVSDISNSSLYGIYAVFGFFTGAIMNKLGPRLTMTIGVAGYPIYVAGLFYYDRTGHDWFPILGGILLGLSAPMLWSTSGFIQWAYATELEKGKYIAIQYFINQVGSVVGSLVAFGIILGSSNGKTATSITSDGSPTSVYIVMIVLICLAFPLTIFGLVDPKTVRRADGTPVAVFHNLSLGQEMRGVVAVLRDYRVLAMLPVIFSCELALGILPSVNGRYFNLRTRSMNNVIFYLVQLPASVGCAYLTDRSPFRRRRDRGYLSVSILGAFVFAGWIALLAWVCTSSTWASPPEGGVDWTDSSNFRGPFVLYLLFGIVYGSHQQIGMWVMGTFTNEPTVLAVYGGLWKGVAAGGVAVQFGMGAAKVSYEYASIPFCPSRLKRPFKFCANLLQ
ncbi:Major facilitator superfamily domain, general substrate transporter [Cordyceps fumosorosea ARSEF 2679]|uniref:Major facilitator superfamily domain, general substrate transporter n=1 Tax=Cordyceps fumosorosea (strain ARSEF 2679) TaxID=1081104 RepID=A0A162MET6_CORFA|nr:Major facilitator superfamily domain, general substrate transporter [Cordyceps fumosorosea ARSEF 2679]OAA55170.1 Major facilitator superfamily domain, general substrate transporter [Cordyceps fumosorosea ARSEF 2679]